MHCRRKATDTALELNFLEDNVSYANSLLGLSGMESTLGQKVKKEIYVKLRHQVLADSV